MSEGVYSYGHVKTLTEQLVSEALRPCSMNPHRRSSV
jgi:hypothetical protein